MKIIHIENNATILFQADSVLLNKFHTHYVPLDGLFASVSTQIDPAYWAEDGVHPTPAGHSLIAKAWLEAVQA